MTGIWSPQFSYCSGSATLRSLGGKAPWKMVKLPVEQPLPSKVYRRLGPSIVKLEKFTQRQLPIPALFLQRSQKCEILLRFFNSGRLWVATWFRKGQQNGNWERTWEHRWLFCVVSKFRAVCFTQFWKLNVHWEPSENGRDNVLNRP